ncbi:MAG TPA: M15 family metallopeptidase, partial [Actinomycetota bacterium]
MTRRRVLAAAAVAVALVGCSETTEPSSRPLAVRTPAEDAVTEVPPPSPVATPKAKPTPDNPYVTERPPWLGTRVLPEGPQGFGPAQRTPPILRNRRFATPDILPRPKKKGYTATIGPVPRDVLERSTWRPKCPVAVEDLAYLTMTFWGFDRDRHTGEMIVHASVAEQIAGVFERIYEARYPIEEMRVITLKEQRAPITGDTNITSSFECRPVTLGDSWSQHSYGLAIDINSFHNPYWRGDLVAPELATAYLKRNWRRPGMIFEGDAVVQA